MILRFVRVGSVVLVLLFLAACGGGDGGMTDPDPDPDPLVRSITVSPASETVRQEESASYSAEVRDENGQLLSIPPDWSTTDPSVATVDRTGTVTAIAVGEIGVVAEIGGVADTAELTVLRGLPEVAIARPSPDTIVRVDDRVTFEGAATDIDGNRLAGDGLVWETGAGDALGTGERVEAAFGEGDHTIVLTATDAEGVSASDTTSLVAAAQTNLVASSFFARPRGVIKGEETTVFEAVVKNGGQAVDGPIEWVLLRDGAVVESGTLDGLGTLATDTIVTPAVGPFSADRVDFAFEVDPSGRIEESDATDNTGADFIRSYERGYDVDVQIVGQVPDTALVLEQARRLEEIITSDLADVDLSAGEPADLDRRCMEGAEDPDEPVDDMLILVTVQPLSGIAAGRGGPCIQRDRGSVNNGDAVPQPVVGRVWIDEEQVDNLLRSGAFDEVVLHEMLHAVGVGALWRFDGGDDIPPFDLVRAAPDGPRFIGPAASLEWRALGGETSNVPGEEEGAPDASAHWRLSELSGEVMSSVANDGEVISRITVGSLADLFYAVDLSAAEDFALPAAAVTPGAGAVHLGDDHIDTGPVYRVSPDGRVIERVR